MNEKLYLIEQLQAVQGPERDRLLRGLLIKIRDDFPETGAYYHFEVDELLKQLD